MEKQQIATLYENYAKDVYRLALSWLRSTHDAQDILQSVFLKLLDKDITIFPGGEKAWLLTCTANACKNHLRSFWQRSTQALDDSIVLPTKEDKSLWEAVGKLKPTYRAVIHLYYYEGYRQDEIAKILGISRTAVQTRMQRAREILKKELNENG
ncbi:MAG: RNA polymerase sigma factor [Oscillospiraceae bacterium]|nr:RNA polymerase sigma factor [Oscillospiraceae bacterium]